MPYFSEWLDFIEVARRLTEQDLRYWGQLLDAINDGNVRVRGPLNMTIDDRIPPTAFKHQYLMPGKDFAFLSIVVVYRPDLTRYWPTVFPDPYRAEAKNRDEMPKGRGRHSIDDKAQLGEMAALVDAGMSQRKAAKTIGHTPADRERLRSKYRRRYGTKILPD